MSSPIGHSSSSTKRPTTSDRFFLTLLLIRHTVMSTCLQVSGAEYPSVYAGEDLKPTPGKSLLPAIRDPFTVPWSLSEAHDCNAADQTRRVLLCTRLRDHDVGPPNRVCIVGSSEYLWHDGGDCFAVRVDDLFANHHGRFACFFLQSWVAEMRRHRVEARYGGESRVGIQDKFTFLVSRCGAECLFAHPQPLVGF